MVTDASTPAVRSTSGLGLSVRLIKSLRLNRLANSVLQFAPKSLQEKITAWKVQNYLATYGTDAMVVLPVDKLKQKQREALQYLIDKYGAENLGDYLEFGVFSGTSISCMYQVSQEMGLKQMRLFGFDSFEGMPDIAATEDEGTWTPGQFKFGIEFTKGILTARGIDWHRVFLTKGWFCDILKPEFREHHQIKKASILMVDCDLYSSTVDVLAFCEPLIQDETIVFFDDWHSNDLAEKNMGEKKAFDEFLQSHPNFTVQEFGTYAHHAACFIVTRQT
jgi:O-methyltransferase